MIEAKIKLAIRDIPDFPKPGIIFKDITPILKDPALCVAITAALVSQVQHLNIDVVAGVESRGFLFGPAIAQSLGVPFVPVRKAGKLPSKCIKETYELEYGTATMELHEDAFLPGQRILIHDDLLATGGTVAAAAKLIKQLNGEVAAFSFIINLSFLNGKAQLNEINAPIEALATY